MLPVELRIHLCHCMAAAVNLWLPRRVSIFSLSALIQNYCFSYPSIQIQQPQTRLCLQKISCAKQVTVGFLRKDVLPKMKSHTHFLKKNHLEHPQYHVLR